MLLTLLQNANSLLLFFNEVAVLIALGYWGFSTTRGWLLKIGLGIGLPIIAIIIWGQYGAPTSETQLEGLAFFLLRFFFFGSGAVALLAASQRKLGLVFTLLVTVNLALVYAWGQ